MFEQLNEQYCFGVTVHRKKWGQVVMGQLREGKKSIADIHLGFARDGELVEPLAAPARAGSPRHNSKSTYN
jgi:hypothetical protein